MIHDSDSEIKSRYVPTDRDYVHELPAAGPRDQAALLEKKKMAENSILDTIVDTIAANGPMTSAEIYDAADFTFDRKQMSTKLLRLLEYKRVTRNKLDGIYKYSPADSEKEATPAPIQEQKPAAVMAEKDPLVEKIKQMRFGIPDASLHSKRLAALAGVIDDDEVSSYLKELAGIIQ